MGLRELTLCDLSHPEKDATTFLEKNLFFRLQHCNVSVLHCYVLAAHISYPIWQNTLPKSIKHPNYTD